MNPNLSDLKVFDQELALELMENDEELLGEVLEIFRTSTQDSIDNFCASFAAGELTDATRHAHSVKGGSSNVCADRLCCVAQVLEEICASGGNDEVLELQKSMQEEFDRFLSELPIKT